MFTDAYERRHGFRLWVDPATVYPQPYDSGTSGNDWHLKAYISVYRHADRTPKQKLKLYTTCEPFCQLFDDPPEEIVFRTRSEFDHIHRAVDKSLMQLETSEASADLEEMTEKLQQLRLILARKYLDTSTKVQLKPMTMTSVEDGRDSPPLSDVTQRSPRQPSSNAVQKVQIICKWGGELTHAGEMQSRDLGYETRVKFQSKFGCLPQDVRVFSSPETRVTLTAEHFMRNFYRNEVLPDSLLKISKEMLDDSWASKDQMIKVKSRLRHFMNGSGADEHAGYRKKLAFFSDPVDRLTKTYGLMTIVANAIRKALFRPEIHEIARGWCCGESPLLFKERWSKLQRDFCNLEKGYFDISKIPELYDNLKYDALHFRDFLDYFVCRNDLERQLRELYTSSQALFNFVGPLEYGVEDHERWEIGNLTSRPLVNQIMNDLIEGRLSDAPIARLYFTKESFVHTLFNLLNLCGLPLTSSGEISELDYLMQITFELYEYSDPITGERDYRVKLFCGPGAHSDSPLDKNLDTCHSLPIVPPVSISPTMTLETVIECLKQTSLPGAVDSSVGRSLSPTLTGMTSSSAVSSGPSSKRNSQSFF